MEYFNTLCQINAFLKHVFILYIYDKPVLFLKKSINEDLHTLFTREVLLIVSRLLNSNDEITYDIDDDMAFIYRKPLFFISSKKRIICVVRIVSLIQSLHSSTLRMD